MEEGGNEWAIRVLSANRDRPVLKENSPAGTSEDRRFLASRKPETGGAVSGLIRAGIP
jgi:hypothetical protein